MKISKARSIYKALYKVLDFNCEIAIIMFGG